MASDVQINIGAVDNASRVFRDVTKTLSKFSKGVTRIGKTMQDAGGAVSALGKRMAALGGVAIGGVAVASKAYADFDDAMARVSAKSQTFGSDLDMLKEKAKELGATTKFTAAEAASGMEFLAQAGLKTAEIAEAVGPALSLAAAGGVELSEAADIATNVAGGFGLAADEFTRVADVMARAATSSNTDVLMMGETFGNVAPVAKAAGQTLEETAAAMGLLANSGIQAGKAGTHLKIIMQNMVKNREAIKDFGVAIEDANTGEFRDMLDIMEDLGRATAGLSEAEKVKTFTKLFGRGVAAAIVLADSGAESIDGMRDSMTNASVTAESMAEIMQTGLGGTFTRIASAFESVKIALVDTFAVSLKSVGETIAQYLRQGAAWIGQNKQLVRNIIAAAGVVAGLGAGLMALGGTLTAAGVTIAAFGTAASTIVTIVSAIATPVGAVTVAVVALGAALASVAIDAEILSDAFRSVKDMALDLWGTVQKASGGIVDALKAGDWKLAVKIGWAGVKVAFWEGLMDMAWAIGQMIPKMWERVKQFFVDWLNAAKATAEELVKVLTNPFMTLKYATLGPAEMLNRLFGAEGSATDGGIAGFMAGHRDAANAELDALVKEAKEKSEAAARAVAETARITSAASAAVTAASGGAGGGIIVPTGGDTINPQLGVIANANSQQTSILDSINNGIADLIAVSEEEAEPALRVEMVN